MENKEIENRVLNSAFKCRKYQDVESKKTIKYLKSLKNSKEETESPDFLFKDGERYIGVEHFLVDTLRFPEKEKESCSRNLEKASKELLEKYEYGKKFKNNSESKVLACKDIGEEAVKIMNASNNFDNSLFIKEFKRIVFQHKGKVLNYKSKIKKNKNVSEKNISIYFLIEIRFIPQIWNVKEKNGRVHNQSVNGIPFTFEFVEVLKRLINIDHVILYFKDGIDISESDFIYAFSTKDIDKSIKENKKHIYQDFKSVFDGIKTEMVGVKRKDNKIDMYFIKKLIDK